MIIQEIQLLTTYNYDFIINECYYDLHLETALCYQHYFCNTELKITTETNKRTFDLDTTEHVCIIYS